MSEQIPKQNSEKMTQKLEGEDRENFLQKVYSRGRAHFYTHMSSGLADVVERSGRVGWQSFTDNKGELGRVFVAAPEALKFSSGHSQLSQEGIDSVLSIQPVFRGKEPVSLSYYTANPSDSVQAYRVMYFLTNGGRWSNDTRGGKFLAVDIILDEKTARDVFAKAQNDPALLKSLLEKFNPKALEYMESKGAWPEDKKVLVVPEEVDAFDRREVMRNVFEVSGVKKEYIKEF